MRIAIIIQICLICIISIAEVGWARMAQALVCRAIQPAASYIIRRCLVVEASIANLIRVLVIQAGGANIVQVVRAAVVQAAVVQAAVVQAAVVQAVVVQAVVVQAVAALVRAHKSPQFRL